MACLCRQEAKQEFLNIPPREWLGDQRPVRKAQPRGVKALAGCEYRWHVPAPEFRKQLPMALLVSNIGIHECRCGVALRNLCEGVFNMQAGTDYLKALPN